MKHLKNHVSAAKEWLGRAERSLEADNEVQGNLNLMLAQAELRRAQETKRAKGKWYLLIHSMLIASITGVVLVIGFGGFSLFSKETVKKDPVYHTEAETGDAISIAVKKKEESSQKIEMRDDEKKQTVDVVQYETVSGEHPSQTDDVVEDVKIGATAQPIQELNVTPVQMQQLLRAAGKSLRGQE